jgi:large subunit ribosomal protein L10
LKDDLTDGKTDERRKAMITRADKEQEVQQLTDRFRRSKAAFLVDFKGMKVEQVTNLRKKLFPLEAEMKVVRNTLARRAVKEFPKVDAAIGKAFVGTNALIFAYGDVASPAKELSAFAKDVEMFQLKTGYMDGQQLDENKIKFLATLPSKDVLRAQLLGVLQAPATKLARTLKEAPASLVRVLAAKKE